MEQMENSISASLDCSPRCGRKGSTCEDGDGQPHVLPTTCLSITRVHLLCKICLDDQTHCVAIDSHSRSLYQSADGRSDQFSCRVRVSRDQRPAWPLLLREKDCDQTQRHLSTDTGKDVSRVMCKLIAQERSLPRSSLLARRATQEWCRSIIIGAESVLSIRATLCHTLGGMLDAAPWKSI